MGKNKGELNRMKKDCLSKGKGEARAEETCVAEETHVAEETRVAEETHIAEETHVVNKQ